MKKILFSVLALCLITGCGAKEENPVENSGTVDNNEVVESSVICDSEYTNCVKEDQTLYKVVEKDVTLNGNVHKIAFVYSNKVSDITSDGENCDDCFEFGLTVVFDGKKISIPNSEMGIYSDKNQKNLPVVEADNIKVMKDTQTGSEYLMFYYNTASGWNTGHEVMLISDDGRILYNYAQSDGWAVAVNNKTVPFVEIGDNTVTVLKRGENCALAYREKITVKNGKIFNETIYFNEKFEISGGC